MVPLNSFSNSDGFNVPLYPLLLLFQEQFLDVIKTGWLTTNTMKLHLNNHFILNTTLVFLPSVNTRWTFLILETYHWSMGRNTDLHHSGTFLHSFNKNQSCMHETINCVYVSKLQLWFVCNFKHSHNRAVVHALHRNIKTIML